jgi:hypothetical protein
LRKEIGMMVIPNRGRVVAVMVALALIGGLLTLTLLAKPTQAQPSTDNENRGATSQEFPLAGSIDSTECAGEVIDLTGTLHILTHFFADEEGGYHLNSHYNVQNGKGVGQTTGEMYPFASSGAAVENYIPPSGQTTTGSVDMNVVIGKGQVADSSSFIRIHYVITTEGEVKVETVQFHSGCK